MITACGVKPVGLYQWLFEYLWLYGLVEPKTGDSFFYEFGETVPKRENRTLSNLYFQKSFFERYPLPFLPLQMGLGLCWRNARVRVTKCHP